jgi:hypothetical protein
MSQSGGDIASSGSAPIAADVLDYRETFDLLRDEFEQLSKFEEEVRKEEDRNQFYPPGGIFDRKLKQAQARREVCRRNIEEVLQHFALFPPRHQRHREHLRRFVQAGDFARSVFIMTKFPDSSAATPQVAEESAARDRARRAQLAFIIEVVKAHVSDSGFIPRVASEQRFHRWLWDNVELHLLGCRRGIAIVEDKYAPELNPNVAMEWGWMQGMGRDVLYLREESFSHERADWTGLLCETFNWDNPEPRIGMAVRSFLAGVEGKRR